MGRIGAWAIAVAALLVAGQARAECSVSKLAELPISLQGAKPLIPAKLEGREARFEIDTGASFSSITPQAAAYYHLAIGPAPPNMTVYGVGGQVQMRVATVKVFTLDGMNVSDVDFITGGRELGQGIAGLLGLNVLHLADDDFDVANHKLTLLRVKDCAGANLAYWAANRGVSALELEPRSRMKPAVIGPGRVNGLRIRVQLDTGASTSILTLAAAQRAGIRIDGPGVVSAGRTIGVDGRPIQTWVAPVQSFELGGEQIKNTKLRIGEIGVVGLEAPDMLLGADFFRSHHVLVSNSQNKVYFTYEGGPVFDLTQAPSPPIAPRDAASSPAPNP